MAARKRARKRKLEAIEPNSLGGRLHAAMLACNVSRNGLEDLFGFEEREIRRWLYGDSEPRPENLLALSKALTRNGGDERVRIEWLELGIEPMFEATSQAPILRAPEAGLWKRYFHEQGRDLSSDFRDRLRRIDFSLFGYKQLSLEAIDAMAKSLLMHDAYAERLHRRR